MDLTPPTESLILDFNNLIRLTCLLIIFVQTSETFQCEMTDTKDFIKYAVSHIMAQEHVSISTNMRITIEKEALIHLNVKNMGELRDRYEGQVYLDKLIPSVLSLVIIGSILKEKLVDLNQIPKKIEDLSICEFKGEKFQVISTIFGHLPIVQGNLNIPLIVCSIRPDYASGCVCGVLKDFDIEDRKLFLSDSGVVRKASKRFIGFKHLEPLTAI